MEKKKLLLDNKINSTGIISSIKDGICLAAGLKDCFVGETVYIVTNTLKKLEGFILNLEEDYVKIVLIKGKQTWVECGNTVYRTKSLFKTKAGFFVLGKIINPVGEILNKKDLKEKTLDDALNTDHVLVDIVAPGIIKRLSVRKPFLTGITSVDCFIPVGCGQRELIIGDHNTGKTSLAITALLNQKYINHLDLWRGLEKKFSTDEKIFFLPCIYVAVGKRRSEVARLKHLLVVNDAFFYTCFMYASPDDAASIQYLAPYTGCALGEWFMNRGYDSLIIYDDLSEHAVAYRQMSLLLRRPPGREAYPGDVFYLHSRLLERAAQMSLILGGGSLTALPIVETKGGDISSYIPTNVISITDGQLFLSSSLVNMGIRPAIDLQLSVSRVGSSAQCDAMKGISKKMKYYLAMYHALDGSEKLGGVSNYLKPFLIKGKQMYKFFIQPVYQTRPLYQQIIGLYCIGEGFTEKVSLDHLDLFFKLMFDLYFTDFYLKGKEKSIYFNKSSINSLFLFFNFDDLKRYITIFCSKYSDFFSDYLQEKLENDVNNSYYKELLNLTSSLN